MFVGMEFDRDTQQCIDDVDLLLYKMPVYAPFQIRGLFTLALGYKTDAHKSKILAALHYDRLSNTQAFLLSENLVSILDTGMLALTDRGRKLKKSGSYNRLLKIEQWEFDANWSEAFRKSYWWVIAIIGGLIGYLLPTIIKALVSCQ